MGRKRVVVEKVEVPANIVAEVVADMGAVAEVGPKAAAAAEVGVQVIDTADLGYRGLDTADYDFLGFGREEGSKNHAEGWEEFGFEGSGLDVELGVVRSAVEEEHLAEEAVEVVVS